MWRDCGQTEGALREHDKPALRTGRSLVVALTLPLDNCDIEQVISRV